jgi:hypothetical protein
MTWRPGGGPIGPISYRRRSDERCIASEQRSVVLNREGGAPYQRCADLSRQLQTQLMHGIVEVRWSFSANSVQ